MTAEDLTAKMIAYHELWASNCADSYPAEAQFHKDAAAKLRQLAQQGKAVDAVPHTDSAVDAIQAKMADLGFIVPVRVISEGMLAALAPQPKESSNG